MLTMSLGTGVELQIHRRPGSQVAEPPRPVPVAPRLTTAPRLIGSGRIGTALQVDPGTWSGLPVPDITLQWQRGGADIPGATELHVTPAGPDDLARFRCLVTARNILGTASAFSEEIIVTQPSPIAAGGLPSSVFVQGSGDQTLNAFPDFTGASLSFSITGQGASIDPATGLVTIRTDTLGTGLTMLVKARNSGGTATSSFTVTIAAQDPVTVIAPALVKAPALAGSGLIGTVVSLDPGIWSGTPTPDLAIQWQRDGIDIPGATGPDYLPTAADDRLALTCRVTASNPGGSLAATTTLPVTYPAPVASGTLADRILTIGSGEASVEAAPAFTGEGLGFAVTGGGAVIDAATGRISLPADSLRGPETVTVTASNSGGSASLSFTLGVVDVAPVAGAAFADLSYPQNSGTRTLEAAAGFVGANLGYAIATAVAGVTISPATGLVSIATGAVLAATTLTIRATNSGGSLERSLKLTIGAAPTLTGIGIADQLNLVQGSGAATVAAAPAFAGTVTAWSVTAGAGVTIQAATGVISLARAALQAVQTVTVRAANAFGFAETSFAMSVVAAQSAPVIAGAPVISGSATAGAVLSVVDATATGNPAPVISRQWYLAGTAIAGATGASYTTLAAQVGKAITARTIATNAVGSVTSAASNAIGVVDVAPSAGAAFADLSYSQNSGTRTLDAAAGFVGANLGYAIATAVAGVTIDAATGLVSIATTALLATTTLTIRATNSGGSLERSLKLAIGTAPTLTGTRIADQLALVRGTAATSLSAAPAFGGSVTGYAVSGSGSGSGAGVTIHPVTGLLTFAKTATQPLQTVTVTASNAFGSVSTSLQMACAMAVIDPADVTISWRKDPTGASSSSEGVAAGFFTWQFDYDRSKLPETMKTLWWRPDADAAGSGPGAGYHPCIPHPTIANRWIARRAVPETGAPEIKAWLDVVGSKVVGKARTHHFIWSSGDPALLNPLTQMEFSASSAALVQTVALTGAPAFTSDPTVSPASGGVGTAFSVVDGTVTGDPVPTLTRRLLLGTTAVAIPYTALAADVGKTLTPENTATSTGGVIVEQGTPIVISSASPVYARPTTKAEFATAMTNAPAGAIIEIAGGKKGNWQLTSLTAKVRSPGITIRAQDRANPPIFDDALVDLTGWSGLTFDGLVFQCAQPDVVNQYYPFGMVFRGCSNIKVTNCRFSDYFGAITTTGGGSGYELSYNEVRKARCDVFRLYNLSGNVWCHHNKFWDFNINTAWTSYVDPDIGGQNRHPDCFQFACTSSNAPCDGARIEDNYVECLQVNFPQGLHGVAIYSERATSANSAAYAHKNVTVQRNYFKGVNCVAVGFTACNGFTVRDNYMIASPGSNGQDGNTPQVYFSSGCMPLCSNGQITNNAWPLISGQSALKYGPAGGGGGAGLGDTITQSGNLVAPGSFPVGWSGFDAAKGIYGPYGNG